MSNVTTLEAMRQLRRERARIGDFSEPDDALDLAVPIERTSDGMRRVALMSSASDTRGWSLSPEQAEELARYLVDEAAKARAANTR